MLASLGALFLISVLCEFVHTFYLMTWLVMECDARLLLCSDVWPREKYVFSAITLPMPWSLKGDPWCWGTGVTDHMWREKSTCMEPWEARPACTRFAARRLH